MSENQSNDSKKINLDQYLPLVDKLARNLQMRLRLPALVELNDLIQSGRLGLLEAHRRYNPEKGANFATYASRRVTGAMLDELRKRDWLPRHVRQQVREAEGVNRALEQQYGQSVTSYEIAKMMEVPIHEYYQSIKNRASLVSERWDEIENQEWQAQAHDPSQRLIDEQNQAALQKALASLENIRERQAIELYFLQHWSLSEVGQFLSVSESRVCQLHRQAFAKLKKCLIQN